MIVILNGPLGIGKSTLAEALHESIESCAMLDGDKLVALNPPPDDEVACLHDAIELLVAHHRRGGYRHFVINHVWTDPAALADLCSRLAADEPVIRCFRLTLPEEDNLARIIRRAEARAIDERAFELAIVSEERARLSRAHGDELGEPFDVSAPVDALVARMLLELELA
jgi:hypothetical protein